MNDELRKIICDYFDPFELVEFLQIPIEDVVDAFEDEIIENIDDVLEMIGIRKDLEE